MNLSNTRHLHQKLTELILQNNDAFAFLLSGIFFILSFMGILNHEMWRDEFQAWYIARDSSSIIDLFKNLRYEGHPGLWHLGLYLISRFTRNPVSMQIFHLIIATGSIYVFAKFSPFTKLQKVLFSFGVFPFYQYGIISRNYGIGVLLVLAFCSLFPRRTKSYLLIAVILGLLANTNIYCTIIAISIGLTLLLEPLLDRDLIRDLSQQKLKIAIGILIFIASVLGAIYQMIPPPDRVRGIGWRTEIDVGELSRALSAISNSYILINELVPLPYGLLAGFSLVLLTLSMVLLIQKRNALILYSLGTSLILLFTYSKFPGTFRHYGNLFILLIACLWIANDEQTVKLPGRFIRRITRFSNTYRNSLVTAILGLHFAAGILAFYRDLLNPYSASKEVAKFIERQQLKDKIIAGYKDSIVSSLPGVINKKIYYLQSDKFGTFLVWKEGNMKEMDSQQILDRVSKITRQNKRDVLLVSHYELKWQELNFPRHDVTISKLSDFTKSLTDEKYFLYLVKYKNTSK